MERRLRLVAVLCQVLLAGVQAQAEDAPSDLCLNAAEAAERAHGIPAGLLRAVGVVESGRDAGGGVAPWPWVLDVDGKGAFFTTRAAALSGLKNALSSRIVSIDVGCFQVNLAQHPNAFRSPDEALDPTLNANYAAGFLAALRLSSPDWETAVARYHSASAIGISYSASVMTAWTGRPFTEAAGPTQDPHVIHVAFFTRLLRLSRRARTAAASGLPIVITPD